MRVLCPREGTKCQPRKTRNKKKLFIRTTTVKTIQINGNKYRTQITNI
jgi:hypothetical protein